MPALILLIPILFVFTVVGGCSPDANTNASMLYFVEQEQGMDAYRTRMVINKDYLRIDEGGDNGDFILFHRREQTIYSISSADKRTLVVGSQEVALKPPQKFRHRVDKDERSYPSVGGSKVYHYRLYTNGQLCYDLYAAEGLLPDALQILSEYHRVLASEQTQVYELMPTEMQSGCDAANHVFLPARHLQHGFPIRQMDMSGRSRELMDYEINVSVSPRLFALPEGYQLMRMEEMRTTLTD